MSSTVGDFIEHYGTKGMQWGVRKKSPRKEAGDYKKAQVLRKKRVAELSNKQLKTANERGNLESKFKKLNPSKVEKGRNGVAAVLAAGGMAIGAYNMINSPLGKSIINRGKKNVYKQLKLFP